MKNAEKEKDMLIKDLIKNKLLNKQIPSFIPDITHYLVMMGSVAYRVSNFSDMDVYGFCIPRRNIFSHTLQDISRGSDKPQNSGWQNTTFRMNKNEATILRSMVLLNTFSLF